MIESCFCSRLSLTHTKASFHEIFQYSVQLKDFLAQHGKIPLVERRNPLLFERNHLEIVLYQDKEWIKKNRLYFNPFKKQPFLFNLVRRSS